MQQLISQVNMHSQTEKTYKNEIKIGRPQPVTLERGEINVLWFERNEDIS